jgi:P-type Cu2+ transporter
MTVQSTERQTVLLDIEGMRCAGCAASVEKHLRAAPGVVDAKVNLVTAMAVVEHAADVFESEELVASLTAKGFISHLRQGNQPLRPTSQAVPYPIGQLLFAIGLLVLSVLGHFAQPAQLPHHHGNSLESVWWHWGLASIALLGPGRFILTDGWHSLRNGHPNMHSLVGLGAGTAYLTSMVALILPKLQWECFFDEPVMLVGAMLLGKTLEHSARQAAAREFDLLLSMQPPLANLLVGDKSIPVPVEQLRVGELVQVLPGERIPVDGLVQTGRSTVDESLLTGESSPVLKIPGDGVTAGTTNQEADLTLRVEKVGDQTILAQTIARVTAAQTRKAPIQRFADQVAGYFAYGVMAIALLTTLAWWAIGSLVPAMTAAPLLLGLKLGIAVLVVACPCALGLATPTAILVGTALGARQGLLIEGSDVMAEMQRVQTVVFDKTGTLTQGRPQVSESRIDWPLADFWPLVAMVAGSTQHPVAAALRSEAQRLGYEPAALMTSQTVPGAGAIAMDSTERAVHLGREAWLLEQGIPAVPAVELNPGANIVHVAIDHQWAGAIATWDPLRPEAKDTVEFLQAQGLEVVMLTGDQLAVAERIGRELGISRIYGDVRPDRKVEIISELQAVGPVAMVGDGLNDAPALALANVGIAIGSTAVTIAAADVVLMRDSLTGVVDAWQLARLTDHKIRQNLFWALVYNCLGIPVAAGLLYPWHLTLSPALAGALMAFSSFSVVLESPRPPGAGSRAPLRLAKVANRDSDQLFSLAGS